MKISSQKNFALRAAFRVRKYIISPVLLTLRGPGGLHQNSLEIDFIVVSDRGE